MLPATPVPALVVRLAADGHPWRVPREADLALRLVNVALAYRPGEPGLPYSFVALPGRYFADLVELALGQSWRGPAVILNPGIAGDTEHLHAVLAELADLAFGSAACTDDAWLVLQEYSGRPLAYAVPPGWRATPKTLLDMRYLSGRDATLDSELLTAMGVRNTLRTIRTAPDTRPLESMPLFQGMEGMAVHAARARRDMLRAGKRHTLAVITHHAGDVLLTTQAIERCGRDIDGIVVHCAYADVARAVGGALPVIEVNGPLPARGDISSPQHPLNEEILYFEQVVAPNLPRDASILFLRPSRGYIEADYTLAAQVAYAVGGRDDTELYPPAFTLEAPDSDTLLAHRASLPQVRGRRVLLHFDGGWPLKVYPPQWQRELIDHLRDAGFEPAVLGASFPDVPSHAFTTLAAFDALLREHDLLIGMDSFPCHYASQRLQLPTVCLFASTRMENLAHAAPAYMATEQGLYCSPCGSREICPRFGGTACLNFVPPATVTELAQLCLHET